MSLVSKLVTINEIQAELKSVMSAKEVSIQEIFNLFNYVYNSNNQKQLMNVIAESIVLTDFMQYKIVFDGLMYEKYVYVHINNDSREFYITATNGTIHIVQSEFSNNFVPSLVDFIEEKINQKLIATTNYIYYNMNLKRVKSADVLVQLSRMD